ncbi:MAG: CPBP family intramembrane metalloprotease [Ferruginibacter sp.]|nr:CPBP family intramembrane metalloprotease [Cytophagales bacterium]
MRKLLVSLREHVSTDFHPGLYGTVAVFLAVTIAANYRFDFEDSVIDAYRGREIRMLWYFLLYGVAYYFTVLAQAWFGQVGTALRQRRFWLLSLAGMGMLAVDGGFYYHRWVADRLFAAEVQPYAVKCLGQLNSLLTILLPCALLYRWSGHRPESFYGLTTRGVNLRPYAGMLLGMVPLVAWASFQPDFLLTYPSYQPTAADPYLATPPWVNALGFELAYGWDFVATELLFRGLLVIGLAQVLGNRAVLPMTVTYAFLHFGKPLGETIGSVFGGYILGVIALYSRNIWGGVALHLGVAWLMELAAFLQLPFR